MSGRAPLVALAVGFIGLSLGLFFAHASGSQTFACVRYASADTGRDAWPGTQQKPFRTIARLLRSLPRGGTGCLRGRFATTVTIRRGGTKRSPLVLRSTSETSRATIAGIVTIADHADWVTLQALRIDGSNPPVPDTVAVKIFGNHATLRGNDITTNGMRICVQTGDANGHSGVAWYPTIVDNRIHDCGNKALAQTYPSGHALYMEADRHALVRGNVIYDTNYGGTIGGRGIQLWPDSEGAMIEQNLVDNSNEWNIIVSGAPYPTGITRDVTIRDNILANPVQYSVTSAWWGGASPQPGIVVKDNCLWGAPGDPLGFEEWLGKQSYVASGNIVANPQFRDPAAKDFRLASGSPCKGKGPDASIAEPWHQ